jgi:hypothetical protein
MLYAVEQGSAAMAAAVLCIRTAGAVQAAKSLDSPRNSVSRQGGKTLAPAERLAQMQLKAHELKSLRQQRRRLRCYRVKRFVQNTIGLRIMI